MAATKMEQQSTDCPICHKLYSEPKILPCGHLLCRDCVITSKKTTAASLCPLCMHALEEPGFSEDACCSVPDALPTDFAMVAMVKSINILRDQHVCYVHSEAGATTYCLNCSVKLCPACINVHAKLPATCVHQVEDLATLTPQSLAAKGFAQCSVHTNKKSKFFCAVHGVFICRSCAESEHPKCTPIGCVNGRVGSYKQVLLEAEENLNRTETSLTQALTELQDHLVTSRASAQITNAEIDATCDSLLASVEACRIRLKTLVTEEHDKIKSAICKQKTLVGQRRDRVASHRSLIKRVLETDNSNSLIAMVTTMEKYINELNTSFTLDAKNLQSTLLTFDKHKATLSNVKHMLGSIGEMDVISIAKREENCWKFHDKCGTNVSLSNNNRTAVFRDLRENSIVISKESLKINTLYEVQVEEVGGTKHFVEEKVGGTKHFVEEVGETKHFVEEGNREVMGYIGVITANPNALTLPSFADRCNQAICIHRYGAFVNGMWRETNYGHALKHLDVGSRVGVLIDSAHCLHFYVDGRDLGVFFSDVKQPCYVLVNLYDFCRKISTLPNTSFQ